MNMKYGKIVNGTFFYAPTCPTVDGKVILSPTLADYVRAGYYPVDDNPPVSTLDNLYSPTGWAYDTPAAPTKCVRNYALDTASGAPASALVQALTGVSVASMTMDQKDTALQIAAEAIRKEHS